VRHALKGLRDLFHGTSDGVAVSGCRRN
jgi:hypothetical protein